MRRISSFFATAMFFSVISSIPAFAGMNIKALNKYNRVGHPMTLSMTATGEWTQAGNDWGYVIDTSTLAESRKEYFDDKELVQQGAFRADGDWYFVDKDTHTINKNCWVTGYDFFDYSPAAGYSVQDWYGCRTYFNAEGKAEKIQFPLLNKNGNTYDESQAVVYDVINTPDEMASSLINAVNNYRTSHGAKALETDKMLLTASKIFSSYLPMDSRYMFEIKQRYTNSSGQTWDIYSTPYYRNISMFMADGQVTQSENDGAICNSIEFISVGKQNANDVVNEWANQKLINHERQSDGREFDLDVTPNLLDKKATCIGAACYMDASGNPYWYMLIA